MVILNYLNEIWKDIPNYEGLYQASNYGRIKSIYYRKERILKPSSNKCGYLQVCLSKNEKRKCFFVHRLVWLAFHGEIPEGMQINHIDEDKTNNKLDNLNLMTPKENSNYGTRNEKVTKAKINGKKSKPVLQYNFEGKLVKNWCSVREVERQLGYLQGNISNCCLGRYKSAYGYIWKYK